MQLYDFDSEDNPCSVAFHPSEQIFCCGFNSGIVRVFDIASAELLAEHEYVALGPLKAIFSFHSKRDSLEWKLYLYL